MSEYLVSCRADLCQATIDELHARGLYLAHGGERQQGAATGPPLHRLIVDVDAESEALPAAREVIEAAGGKAVDLELEGPAAAG
jgi:hypothetical protein